VGAERVDRTERLLNLVVCLMASRVPVSREKIIEVIPGYQGAPNLSALERMFERDKDDLRALGIPLHTIINAHGEVEGYRIAHDEYVMPAITFTAEERSALHIAAAAWQGAVLSGVAQSAVVKLEAQDPGPYSDLDRAAFLRFENTDATLLQLMRALRNQSSVDFDYRRPDQTHSERRRVDPWGVVAHEGFWYLIGYDLDRNARRVFRISRVTGSVRLAGRAIEFPRPSESGIRDLLAGEVLEDSMAQADVWVAGGHAASVRSLATERPLDIGDPAILRVHAQSSATIVQQVSRAGKYAQVISPEDIRQEVLDGLENVLRVHDVELT